MIRQATMKDYDRMMEIFQIARLYMKEKGNPNQWKDDYPGPTFKKEIEDEMVYVFEEDSHIYGVFMLLIGEDPTYSYIEDGQWLNDVVPYGTIHRVASDGSRRGLFNEMVDFCRTKIDNLRIDTHKNNKIMQKLILDYGFKYCGIIYIANGESRLAYHFVDHK